MITTLLVDDDKSALEYLEGLINWESYGFQIVGRANDGDAALRLYNKLKPQLIITDVHMPAMSGIDFASIVRKSDAKVRIIFSSGYIEPEYLLAALHMGVDDYILKHELNEKTLLDRLMMVSHDLRSAEYNAQLALGKLHAYSRTLQSALREQTGSSFSMILMPNPCQPALLKDYWPRMNDGMAASRFFLTSFCLFYDEVPPSSSVGPPLPLSDLESVLDAGDQATLSRMLGDRIDQLGKARDAQGAMAFCTRCLELLTHRGSVTTDQETGNSFELPVAGNKAGSDLTKMCLTWDGLMHWIEEQLINLCVLIAKNQSRSWSPAVLKAIDYIQRNYMRPDLSVDEIAGHAGRGRNRFGLLFKEKTGLTIADYLTRYRIQKAAVLIDSSNYKMYEISTMVGYSTSQYFSKVFKKVLGLTPYEYKTNPRQAGSGQ